MATQLPCKLTGAMPSAIKAVKFTVHFPAFHVDLTVAVIKPLFVKFWHIRQIHLMPVVFVMVRRRNDEHLKVDSPVKNI
jgi:hypothetical protein